MTELTPPTRTARLVVGVLASLALSIGAFWLALVSLFVLYAGVPSWVVAAAVAAVVLGLAVALQHVRRAGAHQ